MRLHEILEKVDVIIETYESGRYLSLENLQKSHRILVGLNYRLTIFNIDYFQNHNTIMYEFKGSAAKGKVFADEAVPEIRMLRKIMEAIDNVVWSMRSEISIIKKEH
jgi:hypothetical protein